MKLCHIVPSLEARHGGPSRSVRALCTALAEAGDDVQLLATDPGAPTAGLEVGDAPHRTTLFRRDWPDRLCRSQGLRRELAAAEADLFHHHALWLRTLHYARAAAQRTQRPLVVSPRGMMSRWAWRHHGGRKALARRLIHPGALEAVTGWHLTSAEEEADLRALGFTQPACVAPNGVVPPSPGSIAAARSHWLEVCPELAGRRVALFHSRFHAKKRVLELMALWRRLAPSDWLLLVTGLPEQYTVVQLSALAGDGAGGSRIAVFSGEGRPSPYAVASLFLLPSHSENFGLSIAEAMAHGVPVAVTDTTPWTGVNARGAGWCVSWESYPAALDAALAESPARLAARGAQARAWMETDFSWGRSADRLRSFYETLGASTP